jgi:hypothetical protein
MTCKELETLINDIARRRVIEAPLRAAAYAHTQNCARCAARLAEEKQLTVGLRALAILDEKRKASANVEAHLVGAFRKQAEAAHQALAPHNTIRLDSLPGQASRWRIPRWAIAAAAVLVLLLALVALRLQTNDAKPVDLNATRQGPAPQEQKPDNPKPDNPVAPPKEATGKSQPRNPAVKDVERMNHRLAKANRNQAKPVEHAAPEEIATSFISLTQGYTLPMSEGGQVVRVELPRSALASFGLPVNAQRLNEPVKADVVLGNDGIARAIRFVR